MIDRLIKEFPRALVVSLIIFLAVLVIRFLIGFKIDFDYLLLVNFTNSMLYGLSLYYGNALVLIYLESKYKNDQFNIKRLLLGGISTLFISLFVIFLLRLIENIIIDNQPFLEYIETEKVDNLIIPMLIFFIVSLLIQALYFYRARNENKVKEQKIIATTANAQFESLKNQIDPHFLFNSLNVLSSLIEENPENAQKFTTSLSKIYRYVLEQKDKDLVSVEEELAFAKTYMNLLKMRFENSISYELPECTNEDAKVVPLSLQLLLENCIKHNIVSEQKPLHIKISIEDYQLVIENNWQKKEVLSDGKGVGIQNIVNRYALLTNRKVTIQQNEEIFTVKLPILTKQITIMENSNYDSENAYYKAKRQVEELKKFYTSLISYCVVIPFLIFINLRFSSHFQWFWFPLFGWGFGLTMKGLRTFGYGNNWEERKIQQILNKENSKQNWK